MCSTTTPSKMTTSVIFSDCITQLQGAKITNPAHEAFLILEHVLQITKEQLLQLDLTQHHLTQDQEKYLRFCLKHRLCLYPLSYITHKRYFWNHEFFVNSSTLDPRPETEGMVQLGLQLLPQDRCYILDLGTGSGCILLSLLGDRKQWLGLGLDFRKRTLQVARYNSRRLKLHKRAKFQYGNWYKTPKIQQKRMFHLCTCNAPYITSNKIALLDHNVLYYEPHEALHGGNNGLLSYLYILKNIARYLVPGGLLIMEHDPEQHQAILLLMTSYNLLHHSSHRDDSNKMRITIAQIPGHLT